METTTLSFQAKFPLIRCDSCGMEYVLIAVTGEDYMREARDNIYCPYCGGREVTG